MKKLLILLMIPATAFAMRYFSQQIYPVACDMSTTSCNSNGVDLSQSSISSVQAVFTGAPVGTMKLQISNDAVTACSANLNPSCNVTHWTDYSGSSQAIAAAGDFQYNLTTVGYRWLRMVYTKTSGTGSLTAIASGKADQ